MPAGTWGWALSPFGAAAVQQRCARSVPKSSQGPKAAPGSQNHVRVPRALLCPPAGSLCSAGHSPGSEEPSQGLTLAPLCLGPECVPEPRVSALAAAGYCRGTRDSRGHQPVSPRCDGSPQQLQASCVSFLWGFLRHDVSHLGFDQLVGMAVLFPCQAVAFLPPTVSGLTAIVRFF